MEQLQRQNRRLLASYKFWRKVCLAVTLVSLTCIVSMAGTIRGLRAAAETVDKQYRERIATETQLRDRAVREMADMSLQLAEMKREQIEAIDMSYSEPEEPQYEYLGEFTITAYCPCKKCCGKCADGLTASGVLAEPGVIAVDPQIIPLGSVVMIDGQEYRAEDTGSGIKGNRIDIYMDSHSAACNYGIQTHEVWLKAGVEN